MRVLILGASGGVGKHLGQFAAEARHDVCVVVRPKTAYTPPVPSGSNTVHVVYGDVLDPHTVQRAIGEMKADARFVGCDAILSSLGIARRNPANPWSKLTSPTDFCERTARNIVDAMRDHDVKRVIAVSAAGVGASAARMNLVMKLMVAFTNVGVGYRSLEEMERVYGDSGLDWLCPRPTRLTTGPRTDNVKIVTDFAMTAAISRADVAAWMIRQLDPATAFDVVKAGTRTPHITTT